MVDKGKFMINTGTIWKLMSKMGKTWYRTALLRNGILIVPFFYCKNDKSLKIT